MTVKTATIRDEISKMYSELIKDPDLEALDVVMATVLGNQAGGTPIALFIVGQSSGGKSELILSLRDISSTYWLSTLTSKTLASGLDSKDSPTGEETALLLRLQNEGKNKGTLLLKEFGSVLSLRSDAKTEVIGQLRDVLDGQYKKTYGTGKEVIWEGTLGIIAGVVLDIERYHDVIGSLGNRWLFLRLPEQADRQGIALEAMNLESSSEQIRNKLRASIKNFVEGLGEIDFDSIRCSYEIQTLLAKTADELTSWRTPVVRDRNKEILYMPIPEGTARVAKAIYKLAKCLAVVRGKDEVTNDELRTIQRICMDSLPSIRRAILQILRVKGEATVENICDITGLSNGRVAYELEDLKLLKAVDSKPVDSTRGRPSNIWFLREA